MNPFLAAAMLASSALGAGGNPAAQQRTDKLIASLRGHPDRVVPAASEFAVKPWAVGQWAVYVLHHIGEASVLRMAVVGKEARGYWVEYDSQGYHHRTVMKILSSHQPKTAEEAADVALAMVRRQDDGSPTTTDLTDSSDPVTQMMRTAKSSLSGLQFQVDPSLPRQDVSATAGTFKGCFGFKLSLGLGPHARVVTGYGHPAVPVFGTVKYSSADGTMTAELIDYGYTGATGVLPAK